MVDLGAVLEGDEEAAGIAAVAAVGQHGAMKGECQLDSAKRKSMSAAVLLAVNLGDSLGLKPFTDLVVGDDHGSGPASDINGITHVIAMTVRNQNEVGGNIGRLDRRRRIAGQERIDQDILAVRFQENTGVAQPANAC